MLKQVLVTFEFLRLLYSNI